MRERRALVVFLLLAGVFVAGLLLAERRKSAVSADRVEAEMEATVAADSVRLFEFDPNTVEYADLRRLGLSSRMAVSLLKYRAAGKNQANHGKPERDNEPVPHEHDGRSTEHRQHHGQNELQQIRRVAQNGLRIILIDMGHFYGLLKSTFRDIPDPE